MNRKTLAKPRRAACVLTLLLMLAGCDASSASTAHPPRPTAVVTPTATSATATQAPTVTDVDPIPLALRAAWGNVAIRRLPTALPDNRVFVFENAVTPDDRWLIGVDAPREFLANITDGGRRPSYLALYEVRTGRLVRLRALLHPASQVLAASADERWIVWSEAADQPNFFDWTLFAYDRRNGQVRQLAQAVRANGQAVPGPYPMPVVSAGRVIWGQAIGPMGPNTPTNALVRLQDLATGQVTTLAVGAGIPSMTWPWALWGQLDLGSGSDQSASGQNMGYVTIKNLSTGQSERLADQPATIVLNRTSVAWDDNTSTQTSSTSDVYLLDDVTKGTNAYTHLDSGAGLQYVTLNDRIVAWTAFSETMVYDRAERRLVMLPVSSGAGINWVGGHLLLWIDPESQAQQDYDTSHNLTPAGTLNILNTSTLPSPPK